MNKTTLISLASLFVIVIALPLYALMEQGRMVRAQADLRERYVFEGIDLYVENCATCHGGAGEGIGMVPALNRSELAEARSDLLFQSIARSSHGTAMASWHEAEGGILNDYQLNEVVTLIQHGDWLEVERVAAVRGINDQPMPAIEYGVAYLETENADDPHQCIDCHEEPKVHGDLFGTNCARCHNSVSWTPAVLTRHNFLLDHGGEGEVACNTCHVVNYAQYDCYACHEDHQQPEMEEVHLNEGITEFADCALCHPTGVEGEAGRLRDEQRLIPFGSQDENVNLFFEPVPLKQDLTSGTLTENTP